MSAARGILAACSALALLLAARTAPAAGPFSDPFLERFRVGAPAGEDALELEDGWPRDLFAPLVPDTTWLREARAYFAPASLRQSHGLLTWRILAPALGSAAAQSAWYERRKREVAALPDGGSIGGTASPFLAELLEAEAIIAWHEKDYERSRSACSRLLRGAEALELSAEARFVWSLRRRWLEERLPVGGSGAADGPWPELLALGAYDAQTGWALWAAQRRARGLPLLPAGCGTARLGRWLAGLREPGLSAADLELAGFGPEAIAGLGAALLPRGAELDRHLALHRQVPAGAPWQEQWVHGRRRQARYSATISEDLASLAALAPALRTDLWRRASEARLLRREWEAGLADLEQALQLSLAKGDRRARGPIATWTVQALVLAVAHGLADRADAVRSLAASGLRGEAWKAFQAELEQRGLGEAIPVGEAAGRLERAEASVRAGLSEDVLWAREDGLAERAARAREPLWGLWLRWGLGLAGDGGDCGEARCRDYRDGLRAAARAGTPAARFAISCASVGRYLRGDALLPDVLAWLLELDLVRQAPEQLRAGPSPLPDLSRALRGRDATVLTRHALLGAALAAGDLRGQLALASDLPQGPLRLDERLRFLYPVPAAGPLLDRLESCGLEAPLILAIARNESLFDPGARSRAGALGWLQIMPFHWPERGYRDGRTLWSDPVSSLELGVRLLREAHGRYGGDPYRAVAAYNAGAGAVARWDRQLGGAADRRLFLAWIGYPETRRYVEKVLRDREIYDWILGGREP